MAATAADPAAAAAAALLAVAAALSAAEDAGCRLLLPLLLLLCCVYNLAMRCLTLSLYCKTRASSGHCSGTGECAWPARNKQRSISQQNKQQLVLVTSTRVSSNRQEALLFMMTMKKRCSQLPSQLTCAVMLGQAFKQHTATPSHPATRHAMLLFACLATHIELGHQDQGQCPWQM
jgi:hypothetical protein